MTYAHTCSCMTSYFNINSDTVLFTHTSVFTKGPPCHTQIFYLQMYTSKENSNQGHPTSEPTLVNKPGSSTKSYNWLLTASLKYELKWFQEN